MSSDSADSLYRAGVRRLADAGISPDEARAETRILLCHALAISHEALRMNPGRTVTAEEADRFGKMVARREAREPLAYITGERAFYGHAFTVTPDVLIPRPETEFLVEAAIRGLSGLPKPRVADVGAGSGAIAVSIALHLPASAVFASDISAAALKVAEANGRRHGVSDRVRFAEGDFLAPLATYGPFDAIVSNPPYIAIEEIETLMPEVRDWEPRIALGTHDDPQHFYRRFAAEAPALLAPGGLLAVEVGEGQAEAVAALWREAGLREIEVTSDYAGIARVVAGRRT